MIDCPFARPPSLTRVLLALICTCTWGLGCANAPPGAGPESVVSQLPRPTQLELVPSSAPVPLFDWTEAVDFDGLRHWFGRREDFASRCEGATIRDAAGYALLEGDHRESTRLTAPLVAACPVDPSLHLWRFASLMALGRIDEAELHRTWYVGLMDSILATGDGTSERTPIVTISNAETFAVLSHLGLTAERHWTLAGPPTLEVFETRSDEGARTSVYFHPAFRALRSTQ